MMDFVDWFDARTSWMDRPDRHGYRIVAGLRLSLLGLRLTAGAMLDGLLSLAHGFAWGALLVVVSAGALLFYGPVIVQVARGRIDSMGAVPYVVAWVVLLGLVLALTGRPT